MQRHRFILKLSRCRPVAPLCGCLDFRIGRRNKISKRRNATGCTKQEGCVCQTSMTCEHAELRQMAELREKMWKVGEVSRILDSNQRPFLCQLDNRRYLHGRLRGIGCIVRDQRQIYAFVDLPKMCEYLHLGDFVIDRGGRKDPIRAGRFRPLSPLNAPARGSCRCNQSGPGLFHSLPE